MKKTVSFIAACILAAGASMAANEAPQSQPAERVSAAPEAVQVAVASDSEHDYRLEREGCCGPQE
jgi:hypothetical protein